MAGDLEMLRHRTWIVPHASGDNGPIFPFAAGDVQPAAKGGEAFATGSE